MKIKLEACQPYFKIPDPLYKLNDSPPMNAKEIGATIKMMVETIRKANIKGVVLPRSGKDIYIDFSDIGKEKALDET